MKAKLKFDISDPDDYIEFKRVIKANDMASMLFKLLRNTKKSIEWELENKDFDKYDTLEYIYDKIWDLVEEHNIDIDEIS
jgi:hypothetical protein